MYVEGSISAEDRRVLLSTARRLMDHLYRKYKEVQEVIAQMHDQSIRLDIDDYVDALEQKEEELAKKDEQLASKDEQIRLLTERLAKLEAEHK